uniref:Sushi domain-containing protein n=1 Tax=Arion vulgaris TaxID=1028688 RepID=A0A0B6ZQR3_9EUPU
MKICTDTASIFVMLLGVVIQCRFGASDVVECDHERQEDRGRRCFKTCESDKDCISSKKKCLCDGKCGQSCINPNLRCLPETLTITDGKVSIAPFNRFGAIASYSCEEGYILVGLHARVCQGDETWMGEAPRCEPNHGFIGQNQDCGPPPRIPNAVHSEKQHLVKFSLGTNLVYTCLPGFSQQKEGVAIAWCVSGGAWVGPNMACSTSGCATPPEISNGYLEMPAQNIMGSQVKYICDPAFFLVGNTERTCLKDGSWDGREPSCQQVVCGPPPKIEHAEHDAPKNQFRFLTGTQLTYTCAFGYYKDGTERAICNAHVGQWIGPNMACKARDCIDPGDINNGRRDPGYRFTYPTRVMYSCNEGFELHGQSPFRECQADGEWSGVLPECKPIQCGELGAPVHGTMIGYGVHFGSQVRFICNIGYKVVGSAERVCQADGTWSGQGTICEEINCGYPGPLRNGYIVGRDTNVGDVLYYRCNIQTNLYKANFSAQCEETGQWSKPLPQCLGQCQIPLILNGTLKKERDGVFVRDGLFVNDGFVAEYNCLNGLVLNDSRPVKCQNGTWTFLPKCVPAPCNQPPPQVADGHRVFFHLAHGSRARYFCIAGYKLVNSHRYMTCEFGKWTGIIPRCEENFCMNPGVLESGEVLKIGTHGKFHFSDYIVTIKHGDRLEYRCDRDHKLVGSKGAACVNGRWSPSDKPKCVRWKHPIFTKLWLPFEENG